MTDLTLPHAEPALSIAAVDSSSVDGTTPAAAGRGSDGTCDGVAGLTTAERASVSDAKAVAVFERTVAHMRRALTGGAEVAADGMGGALSADNTDGAVNDLDRDATDSVLDHAFGDASLMGRTRTRLSLDKIVTAALLADAAARDPDALRIVDDASGVVLLDTPEGVDFSDVRSVLEALAAMAGTPIEVVARIDPDRDEVPADDRCLVAMNGARSASFGEPADLASALRYAGYGVIVVREEGRETKNTGADLSEIADHLVELRLRPSLLGPILRTTTRDADRQIEVLAGRIEAIASDVNITDIKATVAPRLPIEAIVSKLESRVAKRRRHGDGDIPSLEALPGYGPLKEFGLAVAQDLRAFCNGTLSWSEVDPGFVLNGAPGAGKTLFVQALARSAGVPLVIGSLSAWQSERSGHLGDMLRAMRRTFREARQHKACIMLLDELDGIGDRAAFNDNHRSYSTQVLNSLLELLDGAEQRPGVLVVGATNYADRIDPALLRPGRLERVIQVGLPDRHELADIMRFHLGSDLENADLMPAALCLRGGSGADAAGTVRRARAAARRANRSLDLSDLIDAAARGRTLPAGEARRRIAVHESAHAVIGHVLNLGTPGALSIHVDGGSSEIELDDWPIITLARAEDHIVHCLAGRSAEKRIVGSVCAGAGGSAHSDLARATMIAARAVGSWGLGDGPPLWVGAIETDRALETAVARLHGSIRPMLAKAETEAAELVEQHERTILAIATRLEAEGYLEGGEIEPFLTDIKPDNSDQGRREPPGE